MVPNRRRQRAPRVATILLSSVDLIRTPGSWSVVVVSSASHPERARVHAGFLRHAEYAFGDDVALDLVRPAGRWKWPAPTPGSPRSDRPAVRPLRRASRQRPRGACAHEMPGGRYCWAASLPSEPSGPCGRPCSCAARARLAVHSAVRDRISSLATSWRTAGSTWSPRVLRALPRDRRARPAADTTCRVPSTSRSRRAPPGRFAPAARLSGKRTRSGHTTALVHQRRQCNLPAIAHLRHQVLRQHERVGEEHLVERSMSVHLP